MKLRLKKELLLAAGVFIVLRIVMAKLGWRPPSLVGTRVFPSLVLWVAGGLYWAIAGLNSAPTQSSESPASTYFHQLLLGVALVLALWPVTGLTGWFLPQRFHFLVPAGVIIQAGFVLLAVWARRHLGRNWSAEVRIAVGHQLVRTGPSGFCGTLSIPRCWACFLGPRSPPASTTRC